MTGKSLVEYYDLLGKNGHGQLDCESFISLFRKAAIENNEYPNLPDDLRTELVCMPVPPILPSK
tara:strand:- start:74 stop:265 length:192 start_codon:yes stop_codon:yes gene_type:complete